MRGTFGSELRIVLLLITSTACSIRPNSITSAADCASASCDSSGTPGTDVSGPPVIVTQPKSLSAQIDASGSFTVIASGTSPLNYQWTLNGLPIIGATSSTYSISSIQLTNAGSYAVSVSNAFGTVKSLTVTLSISSGKTYVVVQGSMTVPNSAPQGSQVLNVSNFNAMTFNAGDAILFISGQSYTYNFCLENGSGGQANSPVTLTSVGVGANPKLVGQSGAACSKASWADSAPLTLYNQSYITVSNLDFQGGSGAQNGILVWGLNQSISNININSVNVIGFLRSGIQIYVENTTGQQINVTGGSMNNNGNDPAGCAAFDCNGVEYAGSISNSIIQAITANDNGNTGLWLTGVTTVQVLSSTVSGNGINTGGGVGIETSDVNGITISGNQVFSNVSMGATDGDGIDLDHGSQNATVTNNHCYNNDGAGILDYYENKEGSLPNIGNIISNNVVENNAQSHDYAEIDLDNDSPPPTGTLFTATVNNNTVTTNSRGGVVIRHPDEWSVSESGNTTVQ